MASHFDCDGLRRVWEFIRFARLAGGGESRDIWKLGPLCVKRWSARVSRAEVRKRCCISRSLPVCNSMWYVPWFHWTAARWVHGESATHETCNSMLKDVPALADLHPENVVQSVNGPLVIDFALKPPGDHFRKLSPRHVADPQLVHSQLSTTAQPPR